jgi:putative MATE family efflux protein
MDFFVGRWVGKEGFGAISLVYPVTCINIGFQEMIGIGGGTLVSIAIGAKDRKSISDVLGNLILSAIIFSIIVSFIGAYFSKQIVSFIGGDGLLLEYGTIYLKIVFLGSIFGNLAFSSNALIRSEGRVKEAMVIIGAGTVLNIFLDPLFIKVFNWGIVGAAIAMIITHASIAIFNFAYFIKGYSEITFTIKSFRFSPDLISKMFSIGASGMIMQLMIMAQLILVYKSISFYAGANEIAVMGAAFLALQLGFMPISGIAQGIRPLSGMNYGAKMYSRVRDSFKIFSGIATVIAFFSWAMFMLFPEKFLNLFIADTIAVKLNANSFRIILCCFLFYGILFIGVAFFQGIGSGKIASFLMISRWMIFFIPFAIIFPLFFGIKGVWFAFSATDVLIVVLCCYFLYKEFKKLNNSLRR